MRHYDEVEWILFKEKKYSVERVLEMEEHLYKCDECMDIFLSLTTDKEIEDSSRELDEYINKDIIKEVEKISLMKAKKLNNNIFKYYLAVASITIVITANGFFTSMVDFSSQLTRSGKIRDFSQVGDRIEKASESIVEGTANLINRIENGDGGRKNEKEK